jgi:hypothetical protein
MLCHCVCSFQSFKGLWCLHLQGKAVHEEQFDPEDVGITIFQTIRNYLHNGTVSYTTITGFNVGQEVNS